MTALLILGFAAAAALAIASMMETVKRYGPLALSLDAETSQEIRPRGRRSIASRGQLGTPRRALARGRHALRGERRSAVSHAAGQRLDAMARS